MALHVAKVTEEFIRLLAKEYLKDNATLKSVARQHGTSPGTVSNILFRGVAELILDEATSIAISKKAVANTDNIRKTAKRWERASIFREIASVEEDIGYMKRVIEELTFKIETYTEYFFDDECAPSKKSLRCDKAKAQHRLISLENRLKKLNGELYEHK